MSNKQSSVEWLIEELRGSDDKGDFVFNGVITSELIEQAKAMHKEEILDAFWQGDNSNCTSEQNEKEFAENYYNLTYGGNK